MRRPVEQFVFGWHPTNGAAFRIKAVGLAWGAWIRVPPADLAALAAIFREQPVFVQDDGWFTTGPEPMGD